MVHHHPQEGSRVIILGEFMEGGTVVLQDAVTETVTRNLTGIQVRFNINVCNYIYLDV